MDAEHRALEAARVNIVDPRATFHWLDLVNEAAPATYDAIVCNPPFHAGRAADAVTRPEHHRRRGRALKPGGRFYMVANRGLPYEPLLKTQLRRRSRRLADNNKFRVTVGAPLNVAGDQELLVPLRAGDRAFRHAEHAATHRCSASHDEIVSTTSV